MADVILNAGMIAELAQDHGFDLVGFARAETLDVEGERLQNWLGLGFNAGMSWLERSPDGRADPQHVFAGARSLIVLGINYFTDHRHGAIGKISRYAWGEDYHIVVRSRLNKLLDAIKMIDPSIDGRACVDTAPIMDKAWAARAGIGWVGKHSNIISSEIGSWFFIGEVLLNVEFDEYSRPIDDHCGTCTACLDACPTAAIVEPYVVDSSRCISYATIELRDEKLPDEISDNQDGWLYGCDICQEVCPWNRFEKPTGEQAFEPRLDETSLDPFAVIEMTHDEYVERFRHSAMKRAKLSGLKRNAAALIAKNKAGN